MGYLGTLGRVGLGEGSYGVYWFAARRITSQLQQLAFRLNVPLPRERRGVKKWDRKGKRQ